MNASQEFLELIVDYDPEIRELAGAVADLVLDIHPDAWLGLETAWGGFLLFKTASKEGNTVCYLSAHKKHVSLGFAEGSELKDPTGLLQGSGKRQRHVKIKKLADVGRSELRELIRQAWERQPDAKVLEDAVQRLREICLAYPDSSEALSHGHPTFKVGKKSFAVYGIYSPSVAFKADIQLQADLEGDERFFPTPYMANKGWISIRIDEDTNWEQVSELVAHSFAQVASKKQLAALAK
ncbi:MAG TPA: hypothetical protein EYO33_16030 [Phycisphaerales bacterium]|nr:hypothetical protein [Phycisphaerales bacterium]